MSSHGSHQSHGYRSADDEYEEDRGTRWRWKREIGSEWWHLHCESKQSIASDPGGKWSALQFKLKHRRREELGGVYPPSHQHGLLDREVFAGLEAILDDVLAFRIVSNGLKKRVGVLFQNVLTLVQSAGPILEQLKLSGSVKSYRFDFGKLLDAANDGKLVGLRSLVFDSVGIRDAEAEALAAVIGTGRCSSLATLSLRNVYIESAGMEILAASLFFVQSTLRHLVLDNNWRTSSHVALARVLESGHLPHLETLAIPGNDLGADDCEAYAKALSSGSLQSLKELDLQYCHIDDEGAQALALGIGSNMVKDLCKINLEHNEIGDDGVQALANSLKIGGFSGLKEVDLGHNRFTQKCLPSLAQAFESGNLSRMRTLHLYCPHLNEESCSVLFTALLSENSPRLTDVVLGWQSYPALDQMVERNRKHRRILEELGDRTVPATFGKVYLCGDPMVGKTSLRESLERSYLKALFRRETKNRLVPRTRGIDVSPITSSNSLTYEDTISLMIWDMAGQNEYHMIHNSFFPDLGREEGKATAFVVVCRSDDMQRAKEQLDYWLRFISSSINKGVQSARDVFVMVNQIDKTSSILNSIKKWENMVVQEGKKFEGVLNVSRNLFIADVRKRSSVKPLKQSLLQCIQSKLENTKVPEVSHFVHTYLNYWSKERKYFPVVPWKDFLRLVEIAGGPWPEKKVKAAVEYLNESGILIYIDKEFPVEWGVQSRVLVILDPNWLCREIVGYMFLPKEMLLKGEDPFKAKVDPQTGSISIARFNECLRRLLGEWDTSQMEDLKIILLWLGLCYVGEDEKLFIPSLAGEGLASGCSRDARHLQSWDLESSRSRHNGHGEGQSDQWVMGYSLGHGKTEIALVPITVWHRFQVELAQNPQMNAQSGDNFFEIGKDFISFRKDSMAVLVKVYTHPERPTFDDICIFVKPVLKRDAEVLDVNARKQCQVDLANDLVRKLMALWTQVCPGIDYVGRIVWPCPTLDFTPNEIMSFVREKNVEVSQVMNWVQSHGVGRTMNWTVGGEAIKEDQLLSIGDKRLLVEVMQESLSMGRQDLKERLREAVQLLRLPDEVLDEDQARKGFTRDFIQQGASTSQEFEVGIQDPYTHKMLGQMDKKLDIAINGIHQVDGKLDKMDGKLDRIIQESQRVNDRLEDLMIEKRNLVQKVQDVGNMFLEDKESSCPKLVYLGAQTGGWISLKLAAISPTVKVHIHFACEARYNDYVPHIVKDQLGIKMPHLKEWARTIAPWLKISLAILFISAKISANFVAPGTGLLIPQFQAWQNMSSLSEGLECALGYTMEELDEMTRGNLELEKEYVTTLENAASDGSITMDAFEKFPKIYGGSRVAMTKLLGNLSTREYEKKLGFRKVHLRRRDGTSHGVKWICNDCFEKFREDNLATEL